VSYHVSLVRTGRGGAGIREDEIESVIIGQFGFTAVRDEAGNLDEVYKAYGGDIECVELFYARRQEDGPAELWAKTPDEHTLQVMLEIARALGNGARVRGEEYETYKTLEEWYTHPDDADKAPPPPQPAKSGPAKWWAEMPLLVKLSLPMYLYAGLKLLVRHLGP
jgi:hypothetical protein